MAKFGASLSNREIAIARAFESARLTTFSQAVKAFERDDSEKIALWTAQLAALKTYVADKDAAEALAHAEDAMRFPAPVEVAAEATSEVVTVTFQSFEMDMSAETTDAEIREAVEYASQYEFDREDVRADDVQKTIDATVAGLVEARAEVFGQLA